MKNKRVLLFINLIIFVIWLFLLTKIVIQLTSLNLLICFTTILIYCFIIIYKNKYKLNIINIFKFTIYNILICVVVLLIYYIYKNNLISKINNVEELKQLIINSKGWGISLFILIQSLQVVCIPIPSIVTNIVGISIWGYIYGLLFSIVGTILGSSISFFIGRILGIKFIKLILGSSKVDKILNLLNTKGKSFLKLSFFIPFLPDEIICLIAGITDLKFYEFLGMCLFLRPISIILYTFIATGVFTPFNTVKTIIYTLVFIILVIVFLLGKKLFNRKYRLT